MARLGPERKRLLLAGAVGYLLCVWQVLVFVAPLPHLTPRSGEPGLVYLAGPMLNPQVSRKLLLASLEPRGLDRAAVRASVRSHVVRRTIDPELMHPDDPDAWSQVARLNLVSKSRAVLRPTPVYTMASLIPPPGPDKRPLFVAPPGLLAARFESGPDGAASVGHTSRAGTSYGTFQIASGTPTYNNFLRFLQARAPDWHARLTSQGPANTGSAQGQVPQEWRKIAQEDAKRFERLQYEFILNSHYRPAVSEIFEETGVDVSALSPASREVLWSAAVQHGVGGATGIFVTAINALKNRVVEERRILLFEQALIEEVYSCRLKAFGADSRLGRGAMTTRYGKEKSQALGMLDRHHSGT